MRQSGFWLPISFVLFLHDESSVSGCQSRKRGGRESSFPVRKITAVVRESRQSELSHLDSDFENGRLDPWIEESQTNGFQWKIENEISPWNLNNKAPLQLNGKSYLRVNHEINLNFGVAVLRSPHFSLSSSDSEISLSFSFWIRSKWRQFTNLELYLAENGNERLLLSLYNYSVITNQAWESQSISLIGSSSSTLSLVFYAYCGTDIEDAVAIDDIRFISSQFTESTTYNPTASTKVTNTEYISVTTGPTFSSTTIESTSMTPSVEVNSTSTITSTEPTTTATTIPTPSIKSSESTTMPITSTSRTTQSPTTTVSTSFTCPDTSDKKYSVPENPCNGKYYQCSGGIATLKDCQGNLIFNSNSQLCTPCSLVAACAAECNK